MGGGAPTGCCLVSSPPPTHTPAICSLHAATNLETVHKARMRLVGAPVQVGKEPQPYPKRAAGFHLTSDAFLPNLLFKFLNNAEGGLWMLQGKSEMMNKNMTET